MPSYAFQAKNLAGKVVKGELSAATEQEARVRLRSQQLIPVKILEKKSMSFSKPKAKKSNKQTATIKGSVSRKELQIFTRQFAVLISSGVPVVQSLEAMAQGAKSPVFLKILNRIVQDLQSGKQLTDAMALHPNVFDRMYINLVKAGEEGGVLDEILNRLADYIEKSGKIKSKIKGAMVYPAMIIIVAMVVIAAILIFVIPKFVEMFSQNGQELPWLTLQVIAASEFLKSYWYMIILGLVGVFYFLTQYYKTGEGRKNIDTILIQVPVLGALIQKGAVARFSRTLSTLLTAGVRIGECLEISAATAGNWVIENSLVKAKESISKGRTLVEPLKKEKYIPQMVSQMIAIGEQTGNMDVMLAKIADFFEDEVETAAEALTSMMEPILMIVLGGIIAVLVTAMYLPIFTMAGAIG